MYDIKISFKDTISACVCSFLRSLSHSNSTRFKKKIIHSALPSGLEAEPEYLRIYKKNSATSQLVSVHPLIKIFIQDQGMRKKYPKAYSLYSEDYFLSITQRFNKKTVYGWTLFNNFGSRFTLNGALNILNGSNDGSFAGFSNKLDGGFDFRPHGARRKMILG